MLDMQSVFKRCAVGKAIGFVLGLTGFFLLTVMQADIDTRFQWAILLWYTSFGGIIGLASIFDYHPLLNIKLPWYLVSGIMGLWLNFVLTLFIYEQMQQLMYAMFSTDGLLSSPYWFAAEGLILGIFIGYFAQKA
ncbi:hypothetical protein G3R49_02290 [Shewanella sp. WXL01]|uniref:hypothetical protein n=1 Tax=Shewanella sp. WXL01 TaxID=2709721 RepID=UPI00143840A2|nr:hypothetical protein [Shewanella sp. WXL01]NKF49411.1 hypothetical protein [Shewanella sp. WXL01]